jgi:hypothetical protein
MLVVLILAEPMLAKQSVAMQTVAYGLMNPSMRSSHKGTVSKASGRANRPSDAL